LNDELQVRDIKALQTSLDTFTPVALQEGRQLIEEFQSVRRTQGRRRQSGAWLARASWTARRALRQAKGPLDVLFDPGEPAGNFAESGLHITNLAKQVLKFLRWCTEVFAHGA